MDTIGWLDVLCSRWREEHGILAILNYEPKHKQVYNVNTKIRAFTVTSCLTQKANKAIKVSGTAIVRQNIHVNKHRIIS